MEPMTWREFKEHVETLGVTDETEIMDIGVDGFDFELATLHEYDDGSVSIY